MTIKRQSYVQGTGLNLSSEEPEAGGSVGFESLRLPGHHRKVCLKTKSKRKKKEVCVGGGVKELSLNSFASE